MEVFPGTSNIHKLRALYANYVFALYDLESSTFNDCCMRISASLRNLRIALLHTMISESTVSLLAPMGSAARKVDA